MRVSGQSKAGSIAGAVAGSLRVGEDTCLEAIGIQAVYICVKALLIANTFVKAEGMRPVVELDTDKRIIKGREITAILFKVRNAE